MYRCSFCEAVVPPKTPCRRVIKTRMHKHPFRPKVHKKLVVDKNGKLKEEWRDDIGASGTQIVCELPACEECYRKNNVRP